MPTLPNIVVILADDMGYGDAGCYNPDSRIPTRHLDAMAANGMRFTNAHTTSAVCTPSRYGLLTGRYCWRSRLTSGIVWQWDSPLIEPDRATVADLAKRAGYKTACIGKWHLGWDWQDADGRSIGDDLPFGVMDHDGRSVVGERVDYTRRLGGGPVDHGFDHYFGVDVPNFPPYTWFVDDHVAEVPTVPKPDTMFGAPGAAVPDWSLEAMLPTFAQRASDFIAEAALAEEPFLLYLPLTSPHTPIAPNEAFRGTSEAGNYGDFVVETDWVVGQVREALRRAGVADNTLVLFTSDNGPERKVSDPNDIGAYERIRTYGHASMGNWRGIKRDTWEGGHRVPFIAEWPATITAGRECDQLVSLADLFQTVAELVGVETEPHEGEDSASMLSLLQGSDQPIRDHAIYHSQDGTFAICKDDWVLIDGPTGANNEEPAWYRSQRGYTDHDQPAELFHLADDPCERHNRYQEEPAIAAELRRLLNAARQSSVVIEPVEHGDLPA